MAGRIVPVGGHRPTHPQCHTSALATDNAIRFVLPQIRIRTYHFVFLNYFIIRNFSPDHTATLKTNSAGELPSFKNAKNKSAQQEKANLCKSR
jgi:hypothetical protein